MVFLRGEAGQSGQVTDEKGRFVFAGLSAYEGYGLRVVCPGYLDTTFGGPTSAGESNSRAISLKQGQWLRDIDISLTKSGSVAGVVREVSGQPLVGASVRVLRTVTIAGTRQLAASAPVTTDDRGFYRLAQLTPGRYYVQLLSVQHMIPAQDRVGPAEKGNVGSIRSGEGTLDQNSTASQLVVGRYPMPAATDDGKIRVYPITFYPGVRDFRAAVDVELSGGENRTGADIVVTPAAVGRIHGVLTGASSSLTGLPVRLMLPGMESLGDGGEAATAVVDSHQRFEFSAVPAGDYILDARGRWTQFHTSLVPTADRIGPAPGFRSIDAGVFPIASGDVPLWIDYRTSGVGDYWAVLPVALEKDTVELSVTMHRAATVIGRYEWDGQPMQAMAGRLILAQPSNGSAGLGVVAAESDEKDRERFRIRGLLPGRYILTLTPAAVAQGMNIRAVVCRGREQPGGAIDVRADGSVDDCVVTLTARKTELSGTVSDDRQQVRRDAIVIVFPADSAMWRDIGLTPTRFRRASPNSDGEFRLHTLPAGEFFVIAVSETDASDWLNPEFMKRASTQAQRVTLGWGASIVQNVVLVSPLPRVK
jgi:hypothetical protein